MTNHRTIHTNLYSNIADEILRSVIGQMSDGIWENSPVMGKYWKFIDTDRLANNEIVLLVSEENGKFDGTYRSHHYTENAFKRMSDAEVIEFIARKVKQIAQAELRDNDIRNGWKRGNNDFRLQYLSYHETITISDAYYVYEFLLGRNPDRHPEYTNAEKVAGSKLSANETVAKQRKIDAAKAEEDAYMKSIECANQEEADAIARIKAQYAERRSALWEAHRKVMADLQVA